MLLLLLLLSFAQFPRTQAGEIIGGHEAKPHSRPYMAFLKFFDENSGEDSRCGGFLIRKNVVLTAAHCNGSNMTVTLGAHNIKQKEESQQVISVSKAFLHPDYDSKTFNNDIMLLKLKSNAKMTKVVKPISLPGPRNKGDSGGLLVCKNVAQGIMSYGKKNGTSPRAYTRIFRFMSWIKNTLRRL
ncbi:granzyme B-like [Suncus etruscus]|uniref:granzyme B-like n=1 Tax=Suncus etruscus TaxID=109475 RepID=UPI0021101E10|nr:granzyme B-like [Suncus etruscus]